MSKLTDKLERLLALATLKEGEDKDETRVNEARTASFLVLKTCQENGVKIRFLVPEEKRPESDFFSGPSMNDPFTVFLRNRERVAREQVAQAETIHRGPQGFKRPKQPKSGSGRVDEDIALLNDVLRHTLNDRERDAFVGMLERLKKSRYTGLTEKQRAWVMAVRAGM